MQYLIGKIIRNAFENRGKNDDVIKSQNETTNVKNKSE